MPWKVIERKDGYYVAKEEKLKNGRYEVIHNKPHKTKQEAIKHLYALNKNYYSK